MACSGLKQGFSVSFLPSSGLTPVLDLKGCGKFKCDLLFPSPLGKPSLHATQVPGAVLLKSGWLISSGLRAGWMKIEALSQQTSPQTVLCPCLAAKLFSDLLSGFGLPRRLII